MVGGHTLFDGNAMDTELPTRENATSEAGRGIFDTTYLVFSTASIPTIVCTIDDALAQGEAVDTNDKVLKYFQK